MLRSFSNYQAPVVWNQLPVSVRHSTSVSSFKSSIQILFLFFNNITAESFGGQLFCPRALPTKLFSAELSLRNLDSAGKLYYQTASMLLYVRETHTVYYGRSRGMRAVTHTVY